MSLLILKVCGKRTKDGFEPISREIIKDISTDSFQPHLSEFYRPIIDPFIRCMEEDGLLKKTTA